MKKFLVSVLFSAIALPAVAHGPHQYSPPYRYHYHPNYGWVAPAIIGGVVAYGLTRSWQPAPPPVVEALPQPPLGYHYEQIMDQNCRCLRWVLIAN